MMSQIGEQVILDHHIIDSQHITDTNMTAGDTLRLVSGRTKGLQNALYRGFRYSKDGKPSNASGKQSWRCRLRSCKGRMYTLHSLLQGISTEHNHDPDLDDCEAKAVLSTIKERVAETRTSNAEIYASATGAISTATHLRLPSELACKKQVQRARRLEDPGTRAPGSLAEIELEPVIHSERDTADPTQHFEMLIKNGKPYRIILGGNLFLPKQTRSGGLSVWRCQQYKTYSKCPSRISTRVDLSEPVSAQYDHNHAPPTASALRKQRLKSTLLNADLLKGFAEISEDVEIRPSERYALILII